MKAQDLNKLQEMEFNSIESAKIACLPIIRIAGIKEEERDGYIDIIRLKKELVYRAGMGLYAIWIKNSYNEKGNKIYSISLQTEYTYSFTIIEFLKNAVNEGRAILLPEFEKLINI